MNILTHQKINFNLCGEPIEVEMDYSRVKFYALPEMAVDEKDLVHGGFIFGLADYSAMIAVNDPNVVLGAADVKFLKPVCVGDEIYAEAHVIETKGKKRSVSVIVKRGHDAVFEGKFICFVLEKHVLDVD